VPPPVRLHDATHNNLVGLGSRYGWWLEGGGEGWR
jgi:hypothetical protein